MTRFANDPEWKIKKKENDFKWSKRLAHKRELFYIDKSQMHYDRVTCGMNSY